MSFNPIEVSMAASQAADMLRESGELGGGSVVVDLDKYGLGEIVLYYFTQGGGAKGFEDNSEFWNEFKPGSDTLLRMGYNGYVVDMPVTNLIWYDNGTKCGGASCSFTAVTDKQEIITANIAFSKYGSTTVVVVNVF